MSTSGKKYIARLLHGGSYGLPKQTFRPGETHVVSEETMIHLEEHAVYTRTFFDPYTGYPIGEPVSLFEFEPFTGPEPAGHRFPTVEELHAAEAAKTARARSRRVALAKAAVDEIPARARSRSRAAV